MSCYITMQDLVFLLFSNIRNVFVHYMQLKEHSQ